jgi:uncharacterized membrane protein YvbJ
MLELMGNDRSRICTNCGARYPDSGTICPNCGKNNPDIVSEIAAFERSRISITRHSKKPEIYNDIHIILAILGALGMLMIIYSFLATADSVDSAEFISNMFQWGLLIVLSSIIGVLTLIMSKIGMFE